MKNQRKELKRIKMLNKQMNINDENEIKSFIVILLFIIAVIGVLYLITKVTKNETTSDDSTVQSGTINYDKLSVGMILNRPYDEYYVILYDSNDNNSIIYSTILSNYMNKKGGKDYIKIYYCDLGNELNAPYYNVKNDNISNKNAKKVEEFDFGSLTLLKIKKGKIVSYIENQEKIEELLK